MCGITPWPEKNLRGKHFDQIIIYNNYRYLDLCHIEKIRQVAAYALLGSQVPEEWQLIIMNQSEHGDNYFFSVDELLNSKIGIITDSAIF